MSNLISSYGGVWKLSASNYQRLKKDLKTKEINLDDYGKYLGNVENLRDLEDEARDRN